MKRFDTAYLTWNKGIHNVKAGATDHAHALVKLEEAAASWDVPPQLEMEKAFFR